MLNTLAWILPIFKYFWNLFSCFFHRNESLIYWRLWKVFIFDTVFNDVDVQSCQTFSYFWSLKIQNWRNNATIKSIKYNTALLEVRVFELLLAFCQTCYLWLIRLVSIVGEFVFCCDGKWCECAFYDKKESMCRLLYENVGSMYFGNCIKFILNFWYYATYTSCFFMAPPLLLQQWF